MNKRLPALVAALLASVSFGFGADLDGFLGLPWGGAPDEAKKQIAARSNARFDRQGSDENLLRFQGGKFAGFKADQFEISFSDGRFFRAEVRFEASGKNFDEEFAALKKLLTEKYGAPGRDEPGKHECTWYFPVEGKPANLINLFAAPHGNSLILF